MFRRRRLEAEMEEELRAHLEREEAANRAAGMSLEEARDAARRQFGGIEQAKEACRDQRGLPWIDHLAKDIRFAARQLRRSPGFSVVGLLMLALGVGVTTTAFTLLNRLLLQRLPFHEPGRLVQIWATTVDSPRNWQAPGDYFDLREQNTVFEGVAAFYYDASRTSLTEPGQPAVQCTIMPVSANFFPLMGVDAVLGRTFTAEEEARRERPAVISSAYWRLHYGSDPRILGRTVRLNRTVYTIVGVMPPALDDPELFSGVVSIWPLDLARTNRELREGGWYQLAARLKPGVTLDQANAEMAVLAERIARDHPKTNSGRGMRVVPYPTDQLGETSSRFTWLVMGLSGMVLLIACANLASLQLVRTAARSSEIGIRLALGCTRRRLVGILLTESLMLSLSGGALGLLIAHWGGSYLGRNLQVDMPLNLRVLAFTFAASALTGVLFGTMPAWMASRTDVSASLKPGGRGSTGSRSRHRLRQALVVAELAMSLVLLAGAGYFVRGIYRLAHRDFGWRPENILVAFLPLDHERYGEMRDLRALAFDDRLVAELGALPGVDGVALSFSTPVSQYGQERFAVEDRASPEKGKEPSASFESVSPGFFRAYGIRLLRGRDFGAADRPDSLRVAIISQSMAEGLWPGESPLGKRISLPYAAFGTPEWLEVVGVVNDVTAAGSFEALPTRFAIYRPWAQEWSRFTTITVHSAGDPRLLKDAVRRTVARLQPEIALGDLSTAEEAIEGNLAGYNLARQLLLGISGFGLLLASVGLYGVIANLASERTREIGIRMALGARPGDVIALFLRNGAFLALIGTAAGLLGSIGLMVLLNKTMSIVPGNDPWVVVCVALLLIGVSLLACWLPARRAARVNPIVALRAQ